MGKQSADGSEAMTGEDLRELRKDLGWTMERMAAEIGLSKAFIGMMERGEKPIERRTELAARALADSGATAGDYFVTETEDDIALIEAQVCWDIEEEPSIIVLGPGERDQGHISAFGACDVGWKTMSDVGRLAALFGTAIHIAVSEGIPLADIHKALLVIPEYRNSRWIDND